MTTSSDVAFKVAVWL